MGRILGFILIAVLLIFLVVFGLRACGGQVPLFSSANQGGNLNVDLEEIKPEEWLPYSYDEISGLVRVNIDTWQDGNEWRDGEEEWLLFYHYDMDAGKNTAYSQLGGVIYDPQNRPRGDDSIAIPDQSPAYLVPYRLLPDYHLPKTGGYLGDDDIDYQQVTIDKKDMKSESPSANRLMVRGKYRGAFNRFAIFWWISEEQGYGAAYASTPGWFSLNKNNPNGWGNWLEGKYIKTLWAWESMNNRSHLCRREQWKLEGDGYPEFVPRAATEPIFAEYGGEITFCNTERPSEPAFPEAQVLAYLQDRDPKRLAPVDPEKQNGKKVDLNIPNYDLLEVLAISEPEELNNGKPPGQLPEVKVDVDFNTNEGWRTMTWTLQMISPKTIKEAVEWRIVAAEDR